MVNLIQPSFARGEIAPFLYGRVDTAIYRVALRRARNVVVHAYGGVSNRCGGKFVGPIKDHTRKPRLIRFKFKATDTYMLEFGHLYMRVMRAGAHVTEPALTGVTATAANPVVCTKTSHGFLDGDEVFLSGFTEMTEVNGRRFVVANKTANTFELTDQVTGANLDGTSFTAETTGGDAARVFTLATPYDEADLFDLKHVQSADVMTITHPSYDPRNLTRQDHHVWTLGLLTFGPDQDHPTGQTLTVNGTPGSSIYRYRVTALNEETQEESLPALDNTASTPESATAANPVVVTDTGHPFLDGDQIEINGFVEMTEVNGRRFTVANKAANTYELEGEDGTGRAAETTGGTANQTFSRVTNGNATLSATNSITVDWAAVTGAGRYVVYREQQGLFGEIGQTEDLTFTDEGETPNLDVSPPKSRNPFFGANQKPAAVGYHEQRRVYGGSNDAPDTSDYSQPGNFENMTRAVPGKPDDAITATLTGSEVDPIRHYVALDDLLVLTGGAEWRVNSGPDAGFTADTIRQKRQSSWGASNLKPIVLGRTVLFAQENRSTIRSLGFELSTDGYTGTDMTIMASHLFTGAGKQMLDMTEVKAPDPLVATVREDGEIVAMTFHEEQQVVAFSTWDTPGGFYESVEALRTTPTEAHDDVYVVARRVVNGSTVRYVERVLPRVREEDVRDAFYVDSGLTFDNPVTITGATAANPVVVTAVAHGFSDGDEVDITAIIWQADVDEFFNQTQPDQLNDKRFVVRNPTADTFELEDVDLGTPIDGTAYNAYVSGGEAREALDTFTGVHHLEGELVVAVGDGSVVTTNSVGAPLVVTDGGFTLDRKVSRLHVGLRYVSDVQTLDIEATRTALSADTFKARRVRVPVVAVQLDASVGLHVGRDSTHLDEVKFRTTEAYGEPTRLFSGFKRLPVPTIWDTSGSILFRQLNPLPMTILAIIPLAVMVEEIGP